MTFAFYMDDQIVDAPHNWEEFTEEIVRDDEKRHVYYNYPLSLTFIGSGYEYLDRVYQNDLNSQTKLTVVQTDNAPTVLLETFIKTSNCTFDLVRKSVDVEIDDSTYQGYIFNNYRVEVGASVDKTKNGVEFTPAQPFQLTIYDPTDGTNFGTTRTAYDVKDVMSNIIAYISDDTVGFESSWYDDLENKLCLIKGVELRNGNERFSPILSLERIFEELWKKFNLYLVVENPLTSPIIRLEEESYLYANDNIVQVIAANNLQRSMDFEKLYSAIRLGSQTAIKEFGSAFMLPFFNFLGFTEEQYNVTGVINVDNVLNLVSQFIIDHNVIEDVLVNNNDEYDDDIFLIEYVPRSNPIAHRGEYYDTSGGARYYNEALLNSNVAQRFNYLGTLVLDSGLAEVGFQSECTTVVDSDLFVPAGIAPSSAFTTNAYPYDDDSTPPNFDLDADYDNTTFEFTAPFNGAYRFSASRILRINFVTLGEIGCWSIMRFRKNGSNEPIDQYEVTITPDIGTPWTQIIDQQNMENNSTPILFDGYDNYTVEFKIERTIELQAGDTLSVFLNERFSQAQAAGTAQISYQIKNGLFLTEANPFQGGAFSNNDPNEYYLGILTSQNIHLSDAQWQVIRTNPSVRIDIDPGDGLARKSYPKQISRKFATGETNFELLFNRLQPVV